MEAARKATLSVGVSYLGLSLSASLNPAKMMGKYHDYELNFTNIGHEESLAVRNIKWRVRTFFGIRLGH